MNTDELNKLWRDPANWTWWSYRCKEDPRILVPKKNPAMGWTINSAHPKAFSTLLVLMCLIFGPPLAVYLLEGRNFNPIHLIVVLAVQAILLVAACVSLLKEPD